MLTLDQNIELFEQFSIKHKALKSFGEGDEWEIGASEVEKFPYMHAVLLGTDKQKDVIVRKFQIELFDLVRSGEENETHVLSDLEQIGFDLMYYLEEAADLNPGLIQIIKDTSLTDFTGRGDSDGAGWFFEVSVRSHIGMNSCNLPIEAGTLLKNNYIYVGDQMAGAFEFVIKDQDGNVLETFNTSGEYVVNVLTRLRQVIGNTNTTIIQNIID